MLVLSRQRDETIMIGDNVEITVVDVRGDKVRLGISAPNHVQVHRKEVYDAIKQENAYATSAAATPELSELAQIGSVKAVSAVRTLGATQKERDKTSCGTAA